MTPIKNIIEKFTPLGTVFAAAACPACFPALAGIGSALGLSFFAQYEREALVVMQIFIFLSLIFAYFSFRRTKYLPSFILTLVAGGFMLFSWYILYHPAVFYTGMVGVVASAFWNLFLEKRMKSCNTK